MKCLLNMTFFPFKKSGKKSWLELYRYIAFSYGWTKSRTFEREFEKIAIKMQILAIVLVETHVFLNGYNNNNNYSSNLYNNLYQTRLWILFHNTSYVSPFGFLYNGQNSIYSDIQYCCCLFHSIVSKIEISTNNWRIQKNMSWKFEIIAVID